MSMREPRSPQASDTRPVARVAGVEHRHGRERGYPRRVSGAINIGRQIESVGKRETRENLYLLLH